ncbi:MAG: leucine-rich repeat protein, partial [Clostridiales bacterium]|nr:leucine-rich repeat protein [Clostridiales bacterium]
MTEIGDYAFAKCDSLKTAVLPEGLTIVKTALFYDCGSLVSISIPSSVTWIFSDAFRNCTSLRNVRLPEGLTKLLGDAFYQCESLTSIVIPSGVMELQYSTFGGATNLSRVILLGGPGKADENTIFSKVSSVKVYYPADKPWSHKDLENVNWIPYKDLFSVEYKTSEEGSVWYSEYAVDGEEYPVFPDEPLKARCEFVGWSKTPNATTSQYVAGDTITVTENTVFYAVFEKITPPDAVNGLKASPSGKGRVSLTWTASSGAEGYLIYGQKNGKYGYVGMTTQGTTYTDKKASATQYNYYWVYPYFKDSNGKMIVGQTA